MNEKTRETTGAWLRLGAAIAALAAGIAAIVIVVELLRPVIG